MKKIVVLAVTVCAGVFAFNAFAGQKPWKETPEYQQIDKDARVSLQNCLNDEKNMTKECIKQTKKMMKARKKELKRAYKEKMKEAE